MRRKPALRPCANCGRETADEIPGVGAIHVYDAVFCSHRCIDSYHRKLSRAARKRYAAKLLNVPEHEG